jgi:hypothetical protein
MFADNTLTPKEAVRLCALGMLAVAEKDGGAIRYGVLAGQVRHFISRVAGPQIDLMGTSIELLRHEGLVEAVDGIGMEDDAPLTLTQAGRRELSQLLTARLRPGSDLSRLIVALKMRFMSLLGRDERLAQLDLLADSIEGELNRLLDLRATLGDDQTSLCDWLDLEIKGLEDRLDWVNHACQSL